MCDLLDWLTSVRSLGMGKVDVTIAGAVLALPGADSLVLTRLSELNSLILGTLSHPLSSYTLNGFGSTCSKLGLEVGALVEDVHEVPVCDGGSASPVSALLPTDLGVVLERRDSVKVVVSLLIALGDLSVQVIFIKLTS